MLYACLGVSECVENSANWYSTPFGSRLLGYEGVEVINPEGGKEDAEEEAQRGRWKQEVLVFFFFFFLNSCLFRFHVLLSGVVWSMVSPVHCVGGW